MNENLIVRTTEFALKLLSEYVKPGDSVLDATMGNGFDTLALAGMVGIGDGRGRVYSFDVQQKALDNTGELLKKNHYDCFVVKDRFRSIENIVPKEEGTIFLYLESHDLIDRHVREPLAGAIFNLGYLPGGDKTMVTLPDSTVRALEKAEKLLKIDGIIVIVIYPGHPGGMEEKNSLLDHLAGLPASEYHASVITPLNQPADAPSIALVTRKK